MFCETGAANKVADGRLLSVERQDVSEERTEHLG